MFSSCASHAPTLVLRNFEGFGTRKYGAKSSHHVDGLDFDGDVMGVQSQEVH